MININVIINMACTGDKKLRFGEFVMICTVFILHAFKTPVNTITGKKTLGFENI